MRTSTLNSICTSALSFACALAGVVGSATSARGQDLYRGTFASGKLTLSLEQSGEDLRGSVTINGTPCLLVGSVHDGRITGEFEFNGQRFPLEGGMESGVLVVTSAGVSHRLVRQVAAGNPLSDTTLSGGGNASSDDAATTSAPTPIDTVSLARKFPQTLGLSNGLSIRFPAGWKRQNMGEFIGLIPSDELIPLSMYMVLSVPFSSKVSIAGPEAAAKLVQVLGNMMPGMTREGNVEMLGENGAEGVRMRFTTPKMAGMSTKIHVYAKNQGDLLILLAGMGSENSLTGRDAIVREMLQTISGGQAATESDGAANEVSRLVAAATSDRVPRATTVAPAQSAASTGARDPALLGVWRSTESFASSGTTLAIETVYRFNEDGTFTLGSQSAGGSATVGISSNFKISSTGTWSAANGVLKTVNQDGETGEVKYLFHEGQLVFKRGNGKYRFWGR